MVGTGMAVEITPVPLGLERSGSISGERALEALIQQAEAYVAWLHAHPAPAPRAIIGRVRGTGPGVSFGSVIEAIRATFAVEMESPFEGSDHIAGGVLLPETAGLHGRNDGVLFLRFEAHTRDLPMHTHEQSDRMIYVLDGRGFFHVSPSGLAGFEGQDVRHVPVRSRDVLLFGRGTMHTFSTGSEPLLLLSYHAPFIPLGDPRQYTVPRRVILPGETADPTRSRITCAPAWSRLA